MQIKEENLAEKKFVNFLNSSICCRIDSLEENKKIISKFTDDRNCVNEFFEEIKTNLSNLSYKKQEIYFNKIYKIIEDQELNFVFLNRRYNKFSFKKDPSEFEKSLASDFKILIEYKRESIVWLSYHLNEIRVFNYSNFSNEFYERYFKEIQKLTNDFELISKDYLIDFVDNIEFLLSRFKKEIEYNLLLIAHRDEYLSRISFKLNNVKSKIEKKIDNYNFNANNYAIYKRYYFENLSPILSKEDRLFLFVFSLKFDLKKANNRFNGGNNFVFELERYEKLIAIIEKPISHDDLNLAKEGVFKLLNQFKKTKLKSLVKLQKFLIELGVVSNNRKEPLNLTENDKKYSPLHYLIFKNESSIRLFYYLIAKYPKKRNKAFFSYVFKFLDSIKMLNTSDQGDYISLIEKEFDEKMSRVQYGTDAKALNLEGIFKELKAEFDNNEIDKSS